MIANAIRAFFQGAAETINPIHPRDPALARMFGIGAQTFSGVDVTHDKVAALPAVMRGTSIISNAMMKMPFYVFRENDEGHTWDKKHPSWHCVSVKPHPNITCGQFRASLNMWAMLWGNAYAHIYRPYWPDGPVQLIPMLPDRTWPYRVSGRGNVTDDLEDADGTLRYATRIGGEVVTSDASEVLHIHGPGPNPFIGWDIVELLKETFGGAIASQEFGNRFYGQGANPAGFIQMDGSLDEEAEERFMATLRNATSGLRTAHRIALLEEGAKFTPWTMELDKAQFLEGKQFDIRLLAMTIGIKVHKLIDGANSAYAALEQANQEHKDDDIVPWVCRWRDEMHDKLLTESEKEEGTHSIDVDDEVMSWVPFRERVAGTVELYNNGLIRKDEGRRKVNFGPSGSKRANDYRIPSNIIYEDDPLPMPAAQFGAKQPPAEQDDDEPEDATPDEPKPDSRFQEVAAAYLQRIAVRLQKAANAKAAKGASEFIAWVDGLKTEEGPTSLQESIDELYRVISGVCNDVTATATADELVQRVEESSATFAEIAKTIIERVPSCPT